MERSDDVVVVAREEWERREADHARLEQRLARLEAAVDRLAPTTAGTEPVTERDALAETEADDALDDTGDTGGDRAGPAGEVEGRAGVTRRRAVGALASAAAGVVVGSVATGAPAAAANNDPLRMGTVLNSATLPTALTVQGTGATYGLGVIDGGLATVAGRAALVGHARAQNFVAAILAQAEGLATGLTAKAGQGPAVEATSTAGSGGRFLNDATSTAAVEVFARAGTGEDDPPTAPGGTAVRAHGRTQLHLFPNRFAEPPTYPGPASEGELRWTGTGLWACIANGNPGRWRRVVGEDTAGAFHVLPTPVRIYDSRPGTIPSQGPKAPFPGGTATRTLDCKHNGSRVPAGATAVVLTLLLTNAARGAGNLTVWAEGAPKPLSNTMVWGGDAGRFTATAISALDAQARIRVNASLATNLVVDVVGYHR